MRNLIIRSLMLLISVFMGMQSPVSAQEIQASATAKRSLFFQSRNPNVGTALNVLHQRITFSRVTMYFDGPVTSCSFNIQKSLDREIWEDLIPLQDCSSSRKFEFVTPILDGFIRFNVPVVSGGGFVNLFWEGFLGIECGISYNGVFSTRVGPDSPTGDELFVSIPSHERWRVYSGSFELQTSAVLGDREVFLTASENGNEYFRTFADGVVKASQLGIFTTAALGFVGTAGLGPSSIHQPADIRTIMIPIYSDAFIPGGHMLSTSTNGLQSGDDYGSATIMVEVCPN